MHIVDLEKQQTEEWRPGVKTRMRTSAANGAAQLCLFEQWCDPGNGAPTHLHSVEEVLHVIKGEADVWIGDTHGTLISGQLMIVPAGRQARKPTTLATGLSGCGHRDGKHITPEDYTEEIILPTLRDCLGDPRSRRRAMIASMTLIYLHDALKKNNKRPPTESASHLLKVFR